MSSMEKFSCCMHDDGHCSYHKLHVHDHEQGCITPLACKAHRACIDGEMLVDTKNQGRIDPRDRACTSSAHSIDSEM